MLSEHQRRRVLEHVARVEALDRQAEEQDRPIREEVARRRAAGDLEGAQALYYSLSGNREVRRRAGRQLAPGPDDTPAKLADDVSRWFEAVKELRPLLALTETGRAALAAGIHRGGRAGDDVRAPYELRDDPAAVYRDARERALAFTPFDPDIARELPWREDPRTGLAEVRAWAQGWLGRGEPASASHAGSIAADDTSGDLPPEDGEDTAGATPPTAPRDLVTLSQAAAMVHRSKRTLEVYVTKGEFPAPAIEGGGGQPHFYEWKTLRPWLADRFNMRDLPENFPQFGDDGRRKPPQRIKVP